MMKYALIAVGALTLAACGNNTPAENEADREAAAIEDQANLEANQLEREADRADEAADMANTNAATVANEQRADNLENQADNVRERADARADDVRDAATPAN
jgi:hypothetical protein